MKEITFEELKKELASLNNIEVSSNNKAELLRRRSNVFGGSGWKSGGGR